jgi:hypothetical protein
VRKDPTKVAKKRSEIEIKGKKLLSTLLIVKIIQLAKKAAPVERTNILGRFIGSNANHGVIMSVVAIPITLKALTGIGGFILYTVARLSQKSGEDLSPSDVEAPWALSGSNRRPTD